MFEYEGSRSEFLKILAEFGEEPAFISRGLAPQTAWEQFVSSCRTQREEFLKWPKRHYAVLASQIAGDWKKLERNVASPEDVEKLMNLHEELSSNCTVPFDFFRTTGSALRQFLRSGHQFNRNWTGFVHSVSLDCVNNPRRDYNQFYEVEKGCAFGRVTPEADFVALPMVNRNELWEKFPCLDLPKLA
ncbi:hypothetical protein Q31a_39230 [Aureliella helgolandensis]|uniref:Uncharacterized protein n=1 Tax=Aureliella helgolandensis TaxID=2527968 RepID=A0A518GAI3_9BACT|nr:hypothetical protein Q31a_39230 [Aureliella helgolandensis]